MKKLNITKADAAPLSAMAIIFICYAAEKAFKRLTEWGNTSAIIQAFVFTLATARNFHAAEQMQKQLFGNFGRHFCF